MCYTDNYLGHMASSYNHHPIPDHLKAALYDLWYFISTTDLGIHFFYTLATGPQAHIHYPFPHNKESYIDAPDSTPTSHHKLMGY